MSVLVLNKAWYPIKIVSNKVAAKMLVRDVAFATEFGPEYIDTIDGIDDNIVHFKLPNGLYYAFNDIIVTQAIYRRIRRLPYPSPRSIFERDDFTCCYCHEKFNVGELTIDHVVPQSKGGEDTYRNLVTACLECNRQKSNMDVIDYLNIYSKTMLYQPMTPSIDIRLFKRTSKPHWNQYLIG